MGMTDTRLGVFLRLSQIDKTDAHEDYSLLSIGDCEIQVPKTHVTILAQLAEEVLERLEELGFIQPIVAVRHQLKVVRHSSFESYRVSDMLTDTSDIAWEERERGVFADEVVKKAINDVGKLLGFDITDRIYWGFYRYTSFCALTVQSVILQKSRKDDWMVDAVLDLMFRWIYAGKYPGSKLYNKDEK